MCIPPCKHHNNPPFKLFDSCLKPSCITSCSDRLYGRYFLWQEKKKQGIHVSLRRVSDICIPQYSIFACCLIPVLTLVVLLVMLDEIDDISFSKKRYFLIVSRMSISVYCIPTRDTHITRDMCMGIHISRGYTYHCDTGANSRKFATFPYGL